LFSVQLQDVTGEILVLTKQQNGSNIRTELDSKFVGRIQAIRPKTALIERALLPAEVILLVILIDL
jgi:hypothetical protein